MSSAMSAFDLEDLIHVEQDFFDSGYKDGYAHGRIHGLIEGRALGREKGFEIWEEIAFYEGFARVWQAVLVKKNGDEKASKSKRQSPSPNPSSHRTETHIRHLLELTGQFPRINPKPSSSNGSASDSEIDDIDVTALLSKIRARYKALCANLGIKPRLRSAAAPPNESISAGLDTDGIGELNIGIEGVSVATDTKKSVVWKVESTGPPEISF